MTGGSTGMPRDARSAIGCCRRQNFRRSSAERCRSGGSRDDALEEVATAAVGFFDFVMYSSAPIPGAFPFALTRNPRLF